MKKSAIAIIVFLCVLILAVAPFFAYKVVKNIIEDNNKVSENNILKEKDDQSIKTSSEEAPKEDENNIKEDIKYIKLPSIDGEKNM